MAQEHTETVHGSLTETLNASSSSTDQSDPLLSRNVSFSRLNAQAPEFVPTRPPTRPDLKQPARIIIPPPPGMIHHVYPPPPSSPFHVPIQGPVPVVHPVHHHHPSHSHHHVHYRSKQPYCGGGRGGGFGEQEFAGQNQKLQNPDADSKNGLSDEAAQKILNQVEYYFSDLNLATTDHLIRCINKDPDGYVPISVVASFNKIKAFISSQSQLASVLRKSSKLVVSEDGKNVKRQHPLTESDMEELQSRIVVAENLPEDHCHQNLMRIFSAVGSVKTIRTCQPQTSNASGFSASRQAKADGTLFRNKLHAFVEYESVELAEKAVAELTDERNWRSGLRVRLMLIRRGSKPTQVRGKRGNDGEGQFEEDGTSTSELQPNEKQYDDYSQQYDSQSHDNAGEEHAYEEVQQRKGRGVRGRGKGRGRGQYHHNNRGNHHTGTPPNNFIMHEQPPTVSKQPPGPRMPDGTRGFAMGRGKPIAVNIA